MFISVTRKKIMFNTLHYLVIAIIFYIVKHGTEVQVLKMGGSAVIKSKLAGRLLR